MNETIQIIVESITFYEWKQYDYVLFYGFMNEIGIYDERRTNSVISMYLFISYLTFYYIYYFNEAYLDIIFIFKKKTNI